MKMMDSKKRRSWTRTAAGALLVLALLATISDAAVASGNVAGTAISLQQGLTSMMTGAAPVMRVVTVPARPAPRSPFQPPTWIPTIPSPPSPPMPPAAPTWVPAPGARVRPR